MLEFLSSIALAQIVTSPPTIPPVPPASVAAPPRSSPTTREVLRPQEVRSLPGQLDTIPVFNSNSPELIQSEGILLSTFPPDGMQVPSAHLNFPLEGRFDIFAHHVVRGVTPDDVRTIYLGLVVHNPTDRAISIDVLQAASYLSQEAPFRELPSYVANPLGNVFAGPGSRTMNDILRGQRQQGWPDLLILPPHSTQLLINLPIPLRSLEALRNGEPLPQHLVPFPLPGSIPPATAANGITQTPPPAPTPTLPSAPRLNGRTVLMHVLSDGPVYVANMAMYGRLNPDGSERAPSTAEWQALLTQSGLVSPRDRSPTAPDQNYFTHFFYGRVSGVAEGSQWTGQLTDSPEVDFLSVPPQGQSLSYLLSSLDRGTFGTGQIQSAPMLARYSDTAYRAHGNYGILYNLTLPLQNNTGVEQQVAILVQTPLKDANFEGGLRFLSPPENQVFFRGTVRLQYNDDFNVPVTRYLHLVQRRGQEGEPLFRLTMPPGDRRLVQVEFLYPPDSTPPQVLTIQTSESQPRGLIGR